MILIIYLNQQIFQTYVYYSTEPIPQTYIYQFSHSTSLSKTHLSIIPLKQFRKRIFQFFHLTSLPNIQLSINTL
jgi:hypothetical protein